MTSELVESNPQIYILYFLPILILWSSWKRIKKLILGEKYHFDRQLNELTVNGIRKSRLDEIEEVEINYNFKNDSDDKYLELKLRGSGKIRIRDFGSKTSLVNDGREIAKFLKIKMMDNFPQGKELLWGDADVDSSLIAHVNEHLKSTDDNR